jgi:hypothetical protein
VTTPPPGADLYCLRIGALDNGSYEIEYFLIIQAASENDGVYERVGLLQFHKDIKRYQRSKIEDVEKAIRESKFEEVTII